MKNLKLRKQIVDCLKYIKNDLGYYVRRELIESHLGHYMDGALLIDIWNEYGNDETIVIRVNPYTDYDGYAEYDLEIGQIRYQNDEEYFNSLLDQIAPTEYQLQEYQQYLRLKQKFGE
jgi:hypothetical protein